MHKQTRIRSRIGSMVLMTFSTAAAADQFACMVGSNPPCLAGFPVEFSGLGVPSDVGFVQLSSPTVTKLGLRNDAKSDIVVGTTTGYVVAYHGDGTFLWARKTGSVAVQSKPAIADIDGDGFPEVVVGAGMAGVSGGGVYVLRNDGTLKCSFTALETQGLTGGVFSSPALGRLDNTRPNEQQIVFGSFDGHVRALHADCSLWWVKGVADDVIDTVWSSPALHDLDHNGQVDVIIGIDSGQGTLPNGTQVGGQVRAFRGNGIGELPGFPKKLQDVVFSSPAIGDLAGFGNDAVVVGYGHCWDMPNCAPGGAVHAVTDEAVYGLSASGSNLAGWPYATPGESSRTDSPALADLDSDGKLETIIGTLDKATPPATDQFGNMHVIRSNGTPYPGWPKQTWIPQTCSTNIQWLDFAASPIAVDLDGNGTPEILAVAAGFVMVWDRNGNQLSRIAPEICSGSPNPAHYQMQANYAIQSTPVAADLLGDGRIEIIVGTASSPSSGRGALYAWKLPNSSATPKNMPWPQFRHDVRNTGVYTADTIFRNGFDA